MEEAWRIPKPVGISSRGNCVMCKVGPLKILDKDPTNCVQHTPPSKRGDSAKNSGPERTSRDHGEWIKFSFLGR